MAPNLWPDEVPEFREQAYGLYQALDQLGSRVLSALALHIGLPEAYFADKTDSGNSILRPIHYPPITTDDIPNVRAGAHEDINLITLLVGASAEGLEVKSRKGEWVPFTADADTIVVNIGDMLQRLTNHVYPSTTHRVVNPPGEKARQPRYSTPFFLHPNPDFVIDVLPSTITPGQPEPLPGADHRAGLPRRAAARDQAQVAAVAGHAGIAFGHPATDTAAKRLSASAASAAARAWHRRADRHAQFATGIGLRRRLRRAGGGQPAEQAKPPARGSVGRTLRTKLASALAPLNNTVPTRGCRRGTR